MARKTRTERHAEDLLNERLPIDVLPYSNGEHFPDEPSGNQVRIMRLADEAAEYVRRRFNVSRRHFVRTSAAFTVGLWAINKVGGGKYGSLAWGAQTVPDVPHDPRWDACQLDNPNVQLDNLPGEFILDTQSHHVMSRPQWRIRQPVHHAFICGVFGLQSQGNKEGGFAGRTNVDPCENVGRFAYFKDIYLDSATTAGVLSPVPAGPDEFNPLPFKEANETAAQMEGLTGSMRVVTHAYVMPNRGYWARQDGFYEGSPETPPPTPLYLQDELDWMEERAMKYRKYLRGWKVYSAFGDFSFRSGFAHDDHIGMAMNERIMDLWERYGIPPVLASHKGIELPTFDTRRLASDDVPGSAAAFPGIRFVIYHAGTNNSSNTTANRNPYPTDIGESDENVDKTAPTVDGLIKSLRDAEMDAQRHIPSGLAHGNTPNVWVDLGSVIFTSSPDAMAIFLAKMIHNLGPRRICYGTDALWGGSPQGFITFLRSLELSDDVKEIYNLPYGLDGDRFDPRVNALAGDDYNQTYANAHPSLTGWPTDGQPHPERTIRNGILGRNAADAYEVDADATYKSMSCDDLQKLRDSYISDQVAGLGQTTPSRSNMVYGPRTRQELVSMLNEDWAKEGWHA